MALPWCAPLENLSSFLNICIVCGLVIRFCNFLKIRQSYWLSNIMLRCEHNIMTINFSSREGPTLVVACGWDTISYSSLIRKVASDNVFVIQVVSIPNLLTFTATPSIANDKTFWIF